MSLLFFYYNGRAGVHAYIYIYIYVRESGQYAWAIVFFCGAFPKRLLRFSFCGSVYCSAAGVCVSVCWNVFMIAYLCWNWAFREIIIFLKYYYGYVRIRGYIFACNINIKINLETYHGCADNDFTDYLLWNIVLILTSNLCFWIKFGIARELRFKCVRYELTAMRCGS